MATTATDIIHGPLDKAAHSTVDAASLDDGVDRVDSGSNGNVDVKKEREFVRYSATPS